MSGATLACLSMAERAESPLGVGVGLKLENVGGGPPNPVPATEAEIARLKAVFDSIDKDASGGLSEFELRTAMERIGQRTISTGELKAMMDQADKDQNGVIDFEEFCLMYGRSIQIEKEEVGGELYDCFRVMDRDGSGFLERSELMQISASHWRPRPLPIAFSSRACSPASRKGREGRPFLRKRVHRIHSPQHSP